MCSFPSVFPSSYALNYQVCCIPTDLSLELVDPYVSSNDTRPLLQYKSSPVEISYYGSQVFSAGNTSYYDREDERLHAIFLSGSWGVTPVCNRVNVTKVGKESGAVYQGGAEEVRGSSWLVVGTAVMVGTVVGLGLV